MFKLSKNQDKTLSELTKKLFQKAKMNNFLSQQLFVKKSLDVTPKKIGVQPQSKSPIHKNKYLIQKNSLIPQNERLDSKKSKSHVLASNNTKKIASNPSFVNYTIPTSLLTEEDKSSQKKFKKNSNVKSKIKKIFNQNQGISHTRQMSKVCIIDDFRKKSQQNTRPPSSKDDSQKSSKPPSQHSSTKPNGSLSLLNQIKQSVMLKQQQNYVRNQENIKQTVNNQELIDKQYKMMKIKTHQRGLSENFEQNSNKSEITNKLIDYIKKQSFQNNQKKIKGQRSISNPDISVQSIKRNIVKMISHFEISQPGKLYTKEIKTNQDSYVLKDKFLGKNDYWFIQVSDGHGTNGHMVAQFVKENLPPYFEAFYTKKFAMKNQTQNNQEISIQQIFKQTFEKVNQDLYQAGIDITFSGATTVSLIIMENQIWCANIGDSRAIIGRVKENKIMHVIALSNDHKPDCPNEQKRILQNGGRVQAYSDEYGNPVGPARVWLADENIPGLAMSRSFGDFVAAQVGCISIPELIQHTLTPDDKFILVASDGIWEQIKIIINNKKKRFLDNAWICQTVYDYYLQNDCKGACEKLVQEATKAWEREDEVIDDITLIVGFF